MLIYKSDLRKAAAEKYVADTSKKFEEEVIAVWAEQDLVKKKQLAITTIIDQFQFPAKAQQFRTKINNATLGKVVDKVVADIMLLAHGERVLK